MPRSDHVRGFALAALCLAAPAAAGTIRGVVHVSGVVTAAPPMSDAYPGRAASMPGMHMVPRGLVTDAVVYVADVPPTVDSALAARPSPRPQLAQKDQAFVPRVVPVAVGTAVDFPNLDPIYHNVFSLSATKRFDLGKYPRGHSKSVRFDRLGQVNVYCDIHSEMEAFVLVLRNHAFVQPAADGSFTLPDLPAGRYELHVWHPDYHEVVRPLDVPEAGETRVELSL